MTTRNEKSLSPEGISLIIGSCEAAKVRVLKYAGLYIEFDRKVTPSQEAPVQEVIAASAAHFPVAEITDIQKNESERALLVDELSLKEDQLAEMWIEDPYSAEQMVVNDQLRESDVGTQD